MKVRRKSRAREPQLGAGELKELTQQASLEVSRIATSVIFLQIPRGMPVMQNLL